MFHSIAGRIVLVLALVAGGSSGASAWGWWDRYCDGPYCLGPPYGNIEPPAIYVYDHQTGPTWTGNGWAHLPIGAYRPRPLEYAPVPRGYYRGRSWHR